MSARARLAFIAGCPATVLWYVVLRVGQRIAFTEADPAQVIYSEHAAYFWRGWTAAYLGAMTAFALWLLVPRHEARILRALPTAIVLAAGALAAQAAFLP